MQLRKVADRSGPEPPRNVRDEQGKLPDPKLPEGALLEPWPLSHVEVIRAGPVQHLSPRFVEAALLEGWLTFDGSTITLHTSPQLVYTITAHPGRYCCHCGDKLPDDPDGAQARVHVAAFHAGEPSPDEANPAGYRCENYYACERVS